MKTELFNVIRVSGDGFETEDSSTGIIHWGNIIVLGEKETDSNQRDVGSDSYKVKLVSKERNSDYVKKFVSELKQMVASSKDSVVSIDLETGTKKSSSGERVTVVTGFAPAKAS